MEIKEYLENLLLKYDNSKKSNICTEYIKYLINHIDKNNDILNKLNNDIEYIDLLYPNLTTFSDDVEEVMLYKKEIILFILKYFDNPILETDELSEYIEPSKTYNYINIDEYDIYDLYNHIISLTDDTNVIRYINLFNPNDSLYDTNIIKYNLLALSKILEFNYDIYFKHDVKVNDTYIDTNNEWWDKYDNIHDIINVNILHNINTIIIGDIINNNMTKYVSSHDIKVNHIMNKDITTEDVYNNTLLSYTNHNSVIIVGNDNINNFNIKDSKNLEHTGYWNNIKMFTINKQEYNLPTKTCIILNKGNTIFLNPNKPIIYFQEINSLHKTKPIIYLSSIIDIKHNVNNTNILINKI